MIRIVSVVLLLAMFAGSAFAECKWVLWHETRTDRLAPGRDDEPALFFHGTSRWEILDAFDTKAQCMSAYWASFDTMKKLQRSIHEGGKYVGEAVSSLQCLPDSVDPRGPKE